MKKFLIYSCLIILSFLLIACSEDEQPLKFNIHEMGKEVHVINKGEKENEYSIVYTDADYGEESILTFKITSEYKTQTLYYGCYKLITDKLTYDSYVDIAREYIEPVKITVNGEEFECRKEFQRWIFDCEPGENIVKIHYDFDMSEIIHIENISCDEFVNKIE